MWYDHIVLGSTMSTEIGESILFGFGLLKLVISLLMKMGVKMKNSIVFITCIGCGLATLRSLSGVSKSK